MVINQIKTKNTLIHRILDASANGIYEIVPDHCRKYKFIALAHYKCISAVIGLQLFRCRLFTWECCISNQLIQILCIQFLSFITLSVVSQNWQINILTAIKLNSFYLIWAVTDDLLVWRKSLCKYFRISEQKVWLFSKKNVDKQWM